LNIATEKHCETKHRTKATHILHAIVHYFEQPTTVFTHGFQKFYIYLPVSY